jgi:hypothetical protein
LVDLDERLKQLEQMRSYLEKDLEDIEEKMKQVLARRSQVIVLGFILKYG